MELKGEYIGLAVTGSSCTSTKIEQEILKLEEIGAIFHPIVSRDVQTMDSRLGDTGEFINQITYITGDDPVLRVEDMEPIDPKAYLGILPIVLCTGNTLAKLANGITDTPVLMVTKTHLRNTELPAISASINDVLRINFKNIGELLNPKNIYLVPFGQDDPVKEPSPMIARTGLIENALREVLEGRQIQPVI